jgi:Xaa-Pro aminopeptidase
VNRKDILEKLKVQNLDAFLVTKGENLRFLTNFSGMEGFAVINANGSCYLITDSRYTYQAGMEVFETKVLEYQSGNLFDKISEALSNAKRVGIESSMNVSFYNKIKSKLNNTEFVDCTNFFEELRMVKSQNEQDLIEASSKLACEAYLKTLEHVKDGITETELSAILEYEMKKRGATKASFDLIVASGYRSAMPHGLASEKKLEMGDIITFDFGSFYKGYASDCTRTISLGRPKDSKAYEIYKIVLDAQLSALSKIKEGVIAKEVDLEARNLITKAGYGDNFGHSTGHGVGLEIHELPHISIESETILKEGMVITVEPGIYLNNKFGIRIEDLVIVTRNGCKNLTNLEKDSLIEL